MESCDGFVVCIEFPDVYNGGRRLPGLSFLFIFPVVILYSFGTDDIRSHHNYVVYAFYVCTKRIHRMKLYNIIMPGA